MDLGAPWQEKAAQLLEMDPHPNLRARRTFLLRPPLLPACPASLAAAASALWLLCRLQPLPLAVWLWRGGLRKACPDTCTGCARCASLTGACCPIGGGRLLRLRGLPTRAGRPWCCLCESGGQEQDDELFRFLEEDEHVSNTCYPTPLDQPLPSIDSQPTTGSPMPKGAPTLRRCQAQVAAWCCCGERGRTVEGSRAC